MDTYDYLVYQEPCIDGSARDRTVHRRLPQKHSSARPLNSYLCQLYPSIRETVFLSHGRLRRVSWKIQKSGWISPTRIGLAASAYTMRPSVLPRNTVTANQDTVRLIFHSGKATVYQASGFAR